MPHTSLALIIIIIIIRLNLWLFYSASLPTLKSTGIGWLSLIHCLCQSGTMRYNDITKIVSIFPSFSSQVHMNCNSLVHDPEAVHWRGRGGGLGLGEGKNGLVHTDIVCIKLSRKSW